MIFLNYLTIILFKTCSKPQHHLPPRCLTSGAMHLPILRIRPCVSTVCRRWRFSLRNTAYWRLKGGLLERNMPPSGIWKAAYRFGFSEIWSDTPSLLSAGCFLWKKPNIIIRKCSYVSTFCMVLCISFLLVS